MQAFDLHLHTRVYSDCSFIDPAELVRHAVRLGLDGIALTEHGMRWPEEKLDSLRRFAEPKGLILINGQEILASSRNGMEGEYLVFGIKKSLYGNISAHDLVDRVHQEGGIVIAAHPYKLSRGGKEHYYGAGDLVYGLGLDALELYHPDHSDVALGKVRKAMEKLGIPGTGSSDAHKIFAVGTSVTIFENPITGEEELIGEIRAGRIRGERRKSLIRPEPGLQPDGEVAE